MTLTYPGPSNTPADLATLDNEEVGSQERIVFLQSRVIWEQLSKKGSCRRSQDVDRRGSQGGCEGAALQQEGDCQVRSRLLLAIVFELA